MTDEVTSTYQIYSATNSINGAEYIGATGRTMERRRYEHLKDAAARKKRGCKAFHAAIRKYGADAFIWRVLASGLSLGEANDLERALIREREPRYNIASGGLISLGTRSHAVVCISTGDFYPSAAAAALALEVHRGVISLICNKGGQTKGGLRFRFADAEEVTRPSRDPAAVAAGRQARIDKLRARRHPPETIARMRAAARKRGVSKETYLAQREKAMRPVVCLQTGTVFPNAASAALAHGVPRATVYDSTLRGGKIIAYAGVSFRHASPVEKSMFNIYDKVA